MEKGFHLVAVDYFRMGGKKALTIFWRFENGEKSEIQAEALFHKE